MADNIITATAAPGTSLDPTAVYKDFQAQQVKQDTERKAISKELLQQRDTDVKAAQDLTTGIPVVAPPRLAQSAEDRDPNALWTAGEPGVKDKFDPGDYKKMAFAVVGMLALGAVSGNGAVSLAGLGGVLKGFNLGFDRRNQIALDKWKGDADEVARHNQALNDVYTDKLNDRTQTLNTRMAQIQAIATANHDYIMAQIALQKDGDAMAMHLIQARAGMAAVVLRNSSGSMADKIYLDAYKTYSGQADKLRGQADTMRKEAKAINESLAKGGSFTMFSDSLEKAGFKANRTGMMQLYSHDLFQANQLEAQAAGADAMAKRYQQKQMDEDADNPEISRVFTSANADFGSVAPFRDGKAISPADATKSPKGVTWYRYDENGAHEISASEAKKAMDNEESAGGVEAVGQAAASAAGDNE